MILSYVIVTHNRCDILLKTLAILYKTTPLPREKWEVWVVDNASTDETINAIQIGFPDVRLIEKTSNDGAPARSEAFPFAKGQYCILLDDDSYPTGSAVTDSIEYLNNHPTTAAVVGRVSLPDGSLEACAFPNIMLSGAVCIRTDVLRNTGGFRKEFFRKAGEYDLSFRIMQAGYSIERFEDIEYRHDKVLTGRSTSLAHKLDIRNNLILVERFLPAEMRYIYYQDWLRRYALFATTNGQTDAIYEAVAEARCYADQDRISGREVLSYSVLEEIFRWRYQANTIESWASDNGIQSVAIADYGKNIYATYRGARLADLFIQAIVVNDDSICGVKYRGIEIKQLLQSVVNSADGIVLSNINPAQVGIWTESIAEVFDGPVLSLWQPRYINSLSVSSDPGSKEVAGK